ncbi:hypothetical protein FB451DRAFT_385100 [Mycena latifolia]|nr:hypothetical protein FB451DRAFT_385100 [Mycena latifolia]
MCSTRPKSLSIAAFRSSSRFPTICCQDADFVFFLVPRPLTLAAGPGYTRGGVWVPCSGGASPSVTGSPCVFWSGVSAPCATASACAFRAFSDRTWDINSAHSRSYLAWRSSSDSYSGGSSNISALRKGSAPWPSGPALSARCSGSRNGLSVRDASDPPAFCGSLCDCHWTNHRHPQGVPSSKSRLLASSLVHLNNQGRVSQPAMESDFKSPPMHTFGTSNRSELSIATIRPCRWILTPSFWMTPYLSSLLVFSLRILSRTLLG